MVMASFEMRVGYRTPQGDQLLVQCPSLAIDWLARACCAWGAVAAARVGRRSPRAALQLSDAVNGRSGEASAFSGRIDQQRSARAAESARLLKRL
jgi:hypothetical protein